MPREQCQPLIWEDAEGFLVGIGLTPRPTIPEEHFGGQLRSVWIGHIKEGNRCPSQFDPHGDQAITHGLDVGGPSRHFQFTPNLGGFRVGEIDDPKRIHTTEGHHISPGSIIAGGEHRLVGHQVQACQPFRLGWVLKRKRFEAHHRRIHHSAGAPTGIYLGNNAQHVTIQSEFEFVGHATCGVEGSHLANGPGRIGDVEDGHAVGRRQVLLGIGRIHCPPGILSRGQEQERVGCVDGLSDGLELHTGPQRGFGWIGQIDGADPSERLVNAGALRIRGRNRAIGPALTGHHQNVPDEAAFDRVSRQCHSGAFLRSSVGGLNQQDLRRVPSALGLGEQRKPFA